MPAVGQRYRLPQLVNDQEAGARPVWSRSKFNDAVIVAVAPDRTVYVRFAYAPGQFQTCSRPEHLFTKARRTR